MITILPRKLQLDENTDHVTYRNKYGLIIPSVTTVLKIINKEALVYWANSLGWKKISVKKELDRTSVIGTLAHNYIESYLQNNEEEQNKIYSDIFKLSQTDMDETINAIKSFTLFWERYGNEFKIIECEKQLCTNSYGGTCDIIAEHNGELCILDLKTSKGFHFTMMLQLAAYWNAYHEIYGKYPKKIAIIKVDKKNGDMAKILWNTDLEYSNIKVYYNIFKDALSMFTDIQLLNEQWDRIEKRI